MSRDSRGEPVSTTSARALDRFETAVTLMAGYFTDPLAVIDEALDEDPGFVMGHCLRAGTDADRRPQKSAEPELRRSVEAAEALASAANTRERGHMAAARAWLDGDFHRTGELYGKVLLDHPRDLLALQVAHQIDFFVGNTPALRDRPAARAAAVGCRRSRLWLRARHAGLRAGGEQHVPPGGGYGAAARSN